MPVAPKTRTRATLAAGVRELLDIDIQAIWPFMLANSWLPRNLPDDWDPISDERGALDHPARCKVTQVGRATRGRAKKVAPCKACALHDVVAQCWTFMQPRETDYMEKFARDLAKLSVELREMDRRYHRLMDAFGKARTVQYRAQLDQFKQSTPYPEVQDALTELAKAPTPHTALRAGNPAGVSSALKSALRGLAAIREEVLSEARNDGRPEYRLSGKGRQPELLTVLWKRLREARFSYREIALILPDGRRPEDQRQRVIDRLKEERRPRRS